MKKLKLKKLKQVSMGIFTATSMSNKLKILLLDAILALDCRCNNVCYFYLLHQLFFQNKETGLCSLSNFKKIFRMSDRSKNDLFSFIFSHTDEFNNSSIHSFPILYDSRVLSNLFIKKKLEIETTFKFEYGKIQYTKFECFLFLH